MVSKLKAELATKAVLPKLITALGLECYIPVLVSIVTSKTPSIKNDNDWAGRTSIAHKKGKAVSCVVEINTTHNKNENEVICTLVHELLHIRLCKFREGIDLSKNYAKLWNRHEEIMVQNIEKIFSLALARKL